MRSIRLERARLATTTVPLRAEVLRVSDTYFLYEEEVPRAGRIVTRYFQRARWLEGKTLLWIGRKSTTGRGEGSAASSSVTLTSSWRAETSFYSIRNY
jgi:hypothetical protein